MAQSASQLRRRGPAPQLQTALLLETAPILNQLVGRASAMPFLNRKFIWLAMICVIASYISFFGLVYGTGLKIYYDIVSSGKIPYTFLGFVLRVLVCNGIACFLTWLVTPLYCDVLYGLFYYVPTKMTEWLRLIDAQNYFLNYLLWNMLDYMVPGNYKWFWFKICLALQLLFAFLTRFLVMSAKNDIEIMWTKLIKLHLLDSCVINSVVICELDGTIIAKTENFNVTSDELKTLIGNYRTQRGVCVDGRNYDYITSNARMLHAQIGPYGVLFSRFDGLHTYKTGQILILCVCEDRFCLIGPSTIFVNQALLTQKFGEYLIQAGF